MALISGSSLIRSISLFHLTLAYYFLTAPHKLVDQNLVFIFGESMGIPHTQAFNEPSAASSLVAAVLAFLAVGDLLAASLPDEVGHYHWGNQAPIRLSFFFALTGYTFLSKGNSVSAPKGEYLREVAGDGLRNSLVFTWAFLEMVTWFWIYVTLRDERREAAAIVQAKRRVAEESL